VVAKGRRRKSATYGEGCSFYSHWRRLANGGARLWVARAVAVVKPWAVEWRQPRSECGWHGGAVVQTVWLTSGAHAVSYFPELSKLAQTWKLKTDTLPYSKTFQILHAARLGYYKQFSQLCRHPNLDIIRVKNPGTDSPCESLMKLKRGLILLENLINSPKILLDLNFTKVNLVGITCM
jgi:hypothetical protein